MTTLKISKERFFHLTLFLTLLNLTWFLKRPPNFKPCDWYENAFWITFGHYLAKNVCFLGFIQFRYVSCTRLFLSATNYLSESKCQLKLHEIHAFIQIFNSLLRFFLFCNLRGPGGATALPPGFGWSVNPFLQGVANYTSIPTPTHSPLRIFYDPEILMLLPWFILSL